MRMYDDKFLIHSLIHDSRDSSFFVRGQIKVLIFFGIHNTACLTTFLNA